MIVDFDQLPDHARIWVYTATQKLSPQEQEKIKSLTDQFLENWMAHGEVLHAGCTLLHDRFLVIGVDESVHAVSGCSIDASVRTVKEVEQLTGITFSDRSLIPFLEDDGIRLVAFGKLKEALEDHQWTAASITFNPSVSTKRELKDSWLVPAARSWLSRYLSMTQPT
jgi:hypothetical protein